MLQLTLDPLQVRGAGHSRPVLGQAGHRPVVGHLARPGGVEPQRAAQELLDSGGGGGLGEVNEGVDGRAVPALPQQAPGAHHEADPALGHEVAHGPYEGGAGAAPHAQGPAVVLGGQAGPGHGAQQLQQPLVAVGQPEVVGGQEDRVQGAQDGVGEQGLVHAQGAAACPARPGRVVTGRPLQDVQGPVGGGALGGVGDDDGPQALPEGRVLPAQDVDGGHVLGA